MYKRALNSFFLKVHPDFFYNNREHQVANESAVAQLNELLNWAKEFKAGTLRAPPATTISLTFYRRADDDEPRVPSTSQDQQDAPVHQQQKQTGRFSGRGFGDGEARAGAGATPSVESLRIQSTFELPEGFTPSEANRGLVERAVNRFLRDLLRRANCIDSVTDSISAAEDAAAARQEAKPLRQRRHPHLKKDATRRAKSLLDEAMESISVQWTLTSAPTLEELIEADQILFSKDLSPLQSSAAMHTLRRHLGELRYEVWESMPVIISDHFGMGEDVTGSITIPWDFTAVQFLSFLAHNRQALHKCRDEAMLLATDVEQLIGELCHALSMDDVLISCSHREALPTLRLLHRNRDLLYGVGVTDLTLEIQPDRFATRANGLVIVSAQMRTHRELKDWLDAIQPKLDLQKSLYKVSKHMLETTMWHLTQFREVVEPAGLDAFQNNDCTYAQRLEWARELFRIAPALAQWDWTDFTFMLAEDVDLDWERSQLTLPHNFDGDALLRYVEDTQRDAAKRKRAVLLAASAASQAAEEAERERQHLRELQLANETRSGSNGEETQMNHSAQSEATGSAAEQRMRDLYRRANPHMEEYLASSPDRVDPLTVERPLSHSVSFNSDNEAEDQLKWEGFYQEPYVDQVPTGDLDDMAHTYMMSNRWHREAAAKKLLEELRGQYGNKSRKFDYQKMGDVLEINNAKVQPKGFPVLARGVNPGGY